MASVQDIIVIFKTHLDLGFTELAAEIARQYNEVYFPRAIAVGEEILRSGRPEGFTWTTGSWLVSQYLAQAGPEEEAKLSAAIDRGIIAWHALPFTLHSEYADAALYRYGLTLSQKLDKRFGKQTIAAKNTDVPGSTRGIVPLLCEAGVRFLHVGVNPSASSPAVPDLFRWQGPDGALLTVMYNSGDYGEFTSVPHTDAAVYFAHTGDNKGPQSAQEIFDVYDRLHEEYPGARVRAGTLDDVAALVARIEERLPVVTGEIGDSWIHGAGSDPQKTSRFRALLRLAPELEKGAREALYHELLPVPEHTWGLDEKSFLGDHEHFARSTFEAMRGDARYKKMEASWAEQRGYIQRAVEALSGADKAAAEQALANCTPGLPALEGWQRLESPHIDLKGWQIELDSRGAVTGLTHNGRVYADAAHPLALFKYEAFSEAEVKAFMDRYIKQVFDWILEDLGKIGLSHEMEAYYSAEAALEAAYTNGEELLALLAIPDEAVTLYGCPRKLCLRLRPEGERMSFDFAWFDKPACRIPEALWLGFCLPAPLTAIRKLGSWIDPMDVISKGNREMHATDGPLRFGDLTLRTDDTALVSVGRPYGYGFYNEQPNTAGGAWMNLGNNLWGTNFPMWNEGDARFRFCLGPCNELNV